jgi:hypothetical protein
LNPLATELARLSIWVHTFVPGLPLTFLDYNLVTGDSLSGIGTLDEVTDILNFEQTSLGMFAGGSSVMREIRDSISRLGDFADASAEQVKEARNTRNEIEGKLEEVRARFDVLSASRIDDSIDTDPVSDTDIKITEEDCYERAQEVLTAVNPLHFPASFPEVFDGDDSGFDVIIGNPPWEKTKMEEHIFWTRYEPGLQRGLSQGERDSRIEELIKERPDLASEYESKKREQEIRSKLLTEGPYPGIGGGDPDMYLAFSWRFWALTQGSGQVGVVLPRGAFGNSSSEQFRRKLLDHAEITDITFIKNRAEWAFNGVGGRYTIGLLCFQKGQSKNELTVPLRGPYPDSKSFEEGVDSEPYRFPVDVAKNWTKTATFPLLPTDTRVIEPFGRLSNTPNLDADFDGEWRVQPATELHATQDKKADDGTRIMHFDDESPDSFWSVYKGSSFNIWEPDTGDRYAWADPEVAIDYVQSQRENSYRYAGSRSPFSEMGEEWVKNKNTLPTWSPRIAFRDITQRTNSRTTIPALIPPQTFVNHTAPYFIWPRGNARDEAYLLGVLSSIPLDWYSRLFVEVHLTYHILKALPVPRPADDDPLRERVIELSGRLAAVDDRYADWANTVGVKYGQLDEKTKQEKIYELDAVVAHLYGLTREHVEVIFETFHDGWDYEERLERVLDYYASWADRLDLEHTNREAERAAGTRNDD